MPENLLETPVEPDAEVPPEQDEAEVSDDPIANDKARQEQLYGLCTKFNLRDQWARQIEILRCTLRRFFWIGLQHVWWNADVGMYQVGPGGSGQMVAEDLNDEETFQEDFNIYTGYGKSFCAVFAQNAASVRFEPDNPKESRSIRAAAEAEKYRRVYEKFNPPKAQQIEIGRLLWTDGRVIAITEPETDESAGGDDDLAPAITEKTCFYGVLETKVPIPENEFRKWPYLKVSTDHDVCTLRYEFKDQADEIDTSSKQSNANEEIARMSRIATAEGVGQLSNDTLAHIGTKDRWWLRPAAFYELGKSERAWWLENYPEGIQVTFCGQTYCGSKNQSMDSVARVMHALPGNGQARPSLSDPEVPIQMEFNDAMNMVIEAIKYTIPETWVDIDEQAYEAIAERKAQYGAYVPFKRNNQEPMEDLFWQSPSAEVPEAVMALLENFQGPLSQFVTGQQPALFGAQMEDQKTARGYAQARDQALGLMIIVWVPFKQFYAGIVEQAARQAAKRDQGFSTQVPIPGKRGKTEVLDIDPSALKGGFACREETDENFPESWTQKSNKYTALLTANNPLLAPILTHPDNMALGKDLYGLEDFTIPDADSRDKQLQEISEMQEGVGPVANEAASLQAAAQDPMAALSGQVPDVQQSSIPVDKYDNHAVELEECIRWINSPEGQKAKRNQPELYQDIVLHADEHAAALQAKAAAMQPPPNQEPPSAGAPVRTPSPSPQGSPGAMATA